MASFQSSSTSTAATAAKKTNPVKRVQAPLVQELDTPDIMQHFALGELKPYKESRTAQLTFKGGKFTFQTPEMECPFGLNVNSRNGKTTYSLQLSFNCRQSNPDIQSFLNFGDKFDNWMVQGGIDNSLAWLKIAPKDANETKIRSKYNSFIKYPTDKTTGERSTEYEPLCGAKLATDKDGKVTCKIVDAKGNEIHVENYAEYICKQSRIKCVMEGGNAWYAAGGFGNGFAITKIYVKRPIDLKGKPCFLPTGKAYDREIAPEILEHLRATTKYPSELAALTMESDFAIGEVKNITGTAARSGRLTLHGKPFAFQAPEMYCPFGISVSEREGKKSYDMTLSFKDRHTEPEIEALYQFGLKFDNWIVQKGIENSVSWLRVPKKDANEDTIKDKNYPFVKFAVDATTGERNTKYEPNLKAKLATKDNVLSCELYDENLNLINPDEINITEFTKRSRIVPIVECAGLWIAAGDYGTSWKATKLIILPAENISYSFVPEGTDEYMVTTSNEEFTSDKPAAAAQQLNGYSFVKDNEDTTVVVEEEEEEVVVDSDEEA